MTHEEIIGNSRVLITAGSETTATLLSGATFHLLRNPATLQRVQSEVRIVFKKEEDITLRSVSTPHLLPYLEAVLQESLRCYPSIPATLPRITGTGGAVIDGNHVPRNVRTKTPPHVNHFPNRSWIFSRSPLASTNGLATAIPPTSPRRTRLPRSAGFPMRQRDTVVMKKRRCSLFLWGLGVVLGKGKSTPPLPYGIK